MINLIASGFVQGVVVFAEPDFVANVRNYVLFFAKDSHGQGKSQVGSPVPVGSHSIIVPPATARGGRDWILVFTNNSHGLQNNPTSAHLFDRSSVVPNLNVSNLTFNDNWSLVVNLGKLGVFCSFLHVCVILV